MSYDLAEMHLYHDLDATGLLEVSATSAAGPWTPLRLPSTMPVREALAAWTTLANAALPAGWDFYADSDGSRAFVYFERSSAGWVRMSPCLATLLGYSTLVANAQLGGGGDIHAHGILWCELRGNEFSVALSFPTEVEEAELNAYRGGRWSTHHHGRASEIIVDFYVGAADWLQLKRSVLLAGHTAMRITTETETPFGEGNFDGAVTVYPFETLHKEQLSTKDPMWIRLRCTMNDEGT